MLQILIENSKLTPEKQKIPWQVLDASTMTMKSEEHFWHLWDELLLNVYQHPEEDIQALTTQFMPLANSCRFPPQWDEGDPEYHAPAACGRDHESHDWIWLQDQSKLTCQAFLSHCKLLTSQCEQYQKAKEKGWAALTSLTTATSSASLMCQEALTTLPKCDYSCPLNQCPAYRRDCFNFGSLNHYTTLCQRPQRMDCLTHNTRARSPWKNRDSSPHDSRNHSWHFRSISKHWQSCSPSTNRWSCCSLSRCPSCSPSSDCSHRHPAETSEVQPHIHAARTAMNWS